VQRRQTRARKTDTARREPLEDTGRMRRRIEGHQQCGGGWRIVRKTKTNKNY
jgi:hypothetical protein